MNDAMWESPAVQRNLGVLKDDGYEVLGPVEGYLAEGYAGMGRMVEPEEIVAAVARILA
jgi:phosphopantothenoylcysteine decarboxylase/phosphopantothenate--cysteine ligase